jgi:MFS family permease
MMGYSLFALTCLGLIFISGFYGILLFFILYGVFYAMIDGTQRAFVVDLAPEGLRASALGLFHTAIGLVALPGGYIAGMLWDGIGPGATFGYGIVLAAASIILFTAVKGERKGRSRTSS